MSRLMLSRFTGPDVEAATWLARESSLVVGEEQRYLGVKPGTGSALVGEPRGKPKGIQAEHQARWIGDLVDDVGEAGNAHRIIQVVAFDVPAALREAVRAWYAEEHIPMLMRADGWLRARRFEVVSPREPTYTSLAIHELRDIAVMDSPERAAARDTPWRAQFASRPWFEGSGRWLYERTQR